MKEKFTYFWDRFEELFAKEWMSKEYIEDCVSLSDFLTKNYPKDLSLPKVYAVEDSIILEWSINDNDISLDMKVNILQAVFHTYNHKTKEQEEFIIDLVEDDSWNKVFDNLKNL